MDLKKFLEDHPVINKAEFARLLWVENKAANTKLANKIAEHGKQRITEKDEARAKEVLAGIAKKILEYIHG
ncbi:hypothetical protein ACFSQ3_01005 [Sphingobacterium corticis]|uniref:Uncharacterized protein n=1 Tax=Sphingobacterium corticis TaxID=1812823 RepID=A0ABW5NH46_9SPHI